MDTKYPVQFTCGRHTSVLTRAEIERMLGTAEMTWLECQLCTPDQLDLIDRVDRCEEDSTGVQISAVALPASACGQCRDELEGLERGALEYDLDAMLS